MANPGLAVIDTDVFSFIFRDRPEAALYNPYLDGVIPAVSFVTVAELYQGAYRNNWSPQNISRLEERLRGFLFLPGDDPVAREWARIQTATRGRNYPANDAWVAACALAYACPLLSHNRKDFHDIPGLELICHAPELRP